MQWGSASGSGVSVTCIETSEIRVQTVLQEAPQGQDMANGGCPVSQEVLHDVVDGCGSRQGPLRRAEPHLLLCWGTGEGHREQITAQGLGFPSWKPLGLRSTQGSSCILHGLWSACSRAMHYEKEEVGLFLVVQGCCPADPQAERSGPALWCLS